MQLTQTTLDDILKGTSRAFYLSLAVLPAGARSPLSLAYLIARAADTVADAPAEPLTDRSALLSQLQLAIRTGRPLTWPEPTGLLPSNTKERHLLVSLPALLDLLQQRPHQEAEAIRQVVETLIDGMLWDQTLFQQDRSKGGLDDPDLERYTYLVAGCVGPFWSRICALSDARLTHLPEERHREMAAEFGKGLQWVNVLRDIPEDQQAGRFYLPSMSEPSFLPRFRSQAGRAISALVTASRYPLLFPSHYLRHRMAVLWPLILALRTMEKLLADGGPRQGVRVKVQRLEVLGWVAVSPLLVASDALLAFVLTRLRQRAERALTSLEDPHAQKTV